ncbi:MAG: hypothetical protein QOH26_1531 [Actinomycetota bacterium]|nr:hypothetical protein [Actinomycetota bacterium]
MIEPAWDVAEETIFAGGLNWRIAVAGPESGPTVLLLHGFPEYWRTWESQIPALADAGFRVYAADLPGYGGTDEPPSYAMDELARCVADLRIELDQDGVHLIGHDWGGMIGHVVATQHPHAVRSLVAACAPHADVFGGVLRDPRQLLRSWYVALFQIPGIEHLVGKKSVIDRASPRCVTEIDSASEMARALEYYRANLRPWKLRQRLGRVEQPGLVIHGARDPAIGRDLMEATAAMFDDLRGFEVIDGGHFVHRTRAAEFNGAVLDFLRSVT